MKKEELTDYELSICKDEYDRLLNEKRRIELQTEAILTMAAIKLSKLYDTKRLDYAHLSNAYSAFKQQDMESIQFQVVNQTIKDVFLPNEDFEFITIIPYESGAFEYYYRYNNKTISIKIPTASTINKDNIVSLDWGIFTVYESIKSNDICNEKILIIRSDDNEFIRRKISDYFMENED